MPVRQVIDRGGVPVRIFTDDVDRQSIEQLVAVSRLPVVVAHVAAMPDVHVGIGATIGSVIPTRRALIPAAVGVDIGCGMAAARLTLDAGRLPDSLRGVREAMEDAVPVGFAAYQEPVADRPTLDALRPDLDTHLRSLAEEVARVVVEERKRVAVRETAAALEPARAPKS